MKLLKLSIFLTFCLSLVLFSCNKASANETSASAESGMSDGIPGVMRDISSMQLVREMGLGWNLGDTLDVCNADRNGDGRIDEHAAVVDETLWGNPMTRPGLFASLKADGITAVRIPVTWRDHLDAQNNIDGKWMNRVQEVVDYAMNEGLYVIINVHHDGGGDPEFGAWIIEWARTDYEKFYARYSAIWKQICARFKNYSDFLIFESMNEVGFDMLGMQKRYDLLNQINQDFVDIVRASGGNNASRHLLIAGYYTDISATCNERFRMPQDKADGESRLILSVHYYTPWQFCTTNLQNTWGTEREVAQMDALIGRLNDHFVNNGVPVIIGEYAASGNDLASCVFFISHLNELCRNYGIAAFLWDNGGGIDRNSETFAWRTPEFLQAMKGE